MKIKLSIKENYLNLELDFSDDLLFKITSDSFKNLDQDFIISGRSVSQPFIYIDKFREIILAKDMFVKNELCYGVFFKFEHYRSGKFLLR